MLGALVVAAAASAVANNSTCAEIGCVPYDRSLPCQCNKECAKHHDCCPDYQQKCATPTPPSGASCKLLGCRAYQKDLPCQCNWNCTLDCCSDYQKECNQPTPPPGPAGPPCDQSPQQFHLSLTRDATQMVVSYTTCKTWSQPASCTAGLKGSSPSGWKKFTGKTSTYTDGGWEGLLHTVLITDLANDGKTEYEYTCVSGPTYGFTALPQRGTLPLTVAAVADLGENCQRDGCGNATIASLIEGAKKGDYSAIIHAGDIAYTSGDESIWDTFMREMEPAAAILPYQVCVGNHESHYNFSGYLHRFSMPGQEKSTEGKVSVNNLYHSYDLGGVHFVAFSTEHSLELQLDWLRADLKKASSPQQRAVVPWIVVYAHKPIYCSTDDYFDCNMNGPKVIGPAIEPLLLEYGVDLFFAGHLHNYERSWPVSGNGTVEKQSYTNVKSPVHMVVGMAGDDEGLTDTWEKQRPAWSAMHSAKLAFSRLVFKSATEMVFELVASETGDIIDTYTLTKTR